MNLIDLGVLVIIVIFLIYGYAKGLIMTVFKFASFFVSVAASWYFYPHVSRFLRGTPLYDALRNWLTESIDLRSLFQGLSENFLNGGGEQLQELPIPRILLNMLASKNTPDIYTMLGVETVEEYIAGFFANMILNVLSIIVIFILTWVILNVAGTLLDLVGRLPVINTLNRAGGLAVGLVMGLAVSWGGLLIMGVLFTTPAYEEVYAYAQGSFAAKWLIDSGFMMELLPGV